MRRFNNVQKISQFLQKHPDTFYLPVEIMKYGYGVKIKTPLQRNAIKILGVLQQHRALKKFEFARIKNAVRARPHFKPSAATRRNTP